MDTITLAKMQELNDKVMMLLQKPNIEEEFLQKLIKDVEKVQATVILNRERFASDRDEIITLCKFIILNINLKISEILETNYTPTTRH